MVFDSAKVPTKAQKGYEGAVPIKATQSCFSLLSGKSDPKTHIQNSQIPRMSLVLNHPTQKNLYRNGKAVADRLTNTCEAEQREQREAMERSLTRDEERIEVLDKMVMRLYEDMIAGRISEQNFNTMLEKTQTEQTELKAKVSEGRKRLSDEAQLANDAKQWVEAIQEYANITELDAATLNRLIKEIVVHERIDEDKTRHISIEIHFNLKPIPEVEQVTA